MSSLLTRLALLAGCAFFTCMALAHFFGLKWPILFVYYNTPLHDYQDKIISFAAIAYIGLWYVESKSRDAVPVVLIVLALTVLGPSSVNMSPTLTNLHSEDQSTTPLLAANRPHRGLLGCAFCVVEAATGRRPNVA
ncbi:hypothetical protein [Shimia sediminis]|uniref:hypothetical protein n=1 Tax=Shimia sediminis TaxID=2497945 RepID=UPI000F8D8363|nr:hypothetical protein [Shimia sediminis]